MTDVTDADAVKSVLRASIPDEVVSYLMDNDMIRRLAFLGEGGEPVG